MLSYPQLLELFEKEKIDYYCNGKLTLAEFFEERNYNEAQQKKFYSLLNSTISNKKESLSKANPPYQSLKELCDYITKEHHQYVAAAILETSEELLKLQQGTNAYPEIQEILSLSDKLFTEIKAHLSKEETVLFRLIRYLDDCKRFAEKPHLGKSRPMVKTVQSLETDHTLSTKVIPQIIKLLSAIKIKNNETGTVKSLLKNFERFEKDLHIHIHLENNILFPNAIDLENNLYKPK
ncbi:MAG: iron-sulfur cluster repair di-iron protein [Ignavibacteria bacterium]|nr:MAG: iron-sulfur cluster repair di-iron protein [Ignavibacteria bacterium]KAF0155773.1 MAG: iron-sulfur cluster repair di-iron protein [Ignavibacteria bacterium]